MKLPVSVGKIGACANRQAVVMETLAGGGKKPFYKSKCSDMIQYVSGQWLGWRWVQQISILNVTFGKAL